MRLSQSALSLLLLLAAACISSIGCSLFDSAAEVRVVIPEPPLPWRQAFPDLCFSLRYPDGSGSIQWQHGALGGSSASVRIFKGCNTPVLAYPWSAEEPSVAPGVLRPAGGLWTADFRSGESGPELVLSWEDGAAAEIFRLLRESVIDAALVNGERLASRMREAPDPWSWDVTAIADTLAAGDFDAYDIDPLPVSDVPLTVPPGTWLLESPFRPPLEPDPGGNILIEGLGFGLHHLFGAGGRMDVFLDERGAAVSYY
jgi:hypothetical protein